MKLRTELHNKRNNEEWMDDHLADMIAKNMYLMTMHFNKIPPEKQESLLKQANMNRNLKKIGKDPAFMRMIENEGLEKLTQKMIEAKGVTIVLEQDREGDVDVTLLDPTAAYINN